MSRIIKAGSNLLGFCIVLAIVLGIVTLFLKVLPDSDAYLREGTVILTSAFIGSMVYDSFKKHIYDAAEGKIKF